MLRPCLQAVHSCKPPTSVKTLQVPSHSESTVPSIKSHKSCVPRVYRNHCRDTMMQRQIVATLEHEQQAVANSHIVVMVEVASLLSTCLVLATRLEWTRRSVLQ
jgi:hypothetical protein